MRTVAVFLLTKTAYVSFKLISRNRWQIHGSNTRRSHRYSWPPCVIKYCYKNAFTKSQILSSQVNYCRPALTFMSVTLLCFHKLLAHQPNSLYPNCRGQIFDNSRTVLRLRVSAKRPDAGPSCRKMKL